MDAALHEETTARAQALLAAGANINAVDFYNGTALSLAILNLRTPAVRFLLQAGADPNLATATEPAPLLAAVERGSLEIVEALVEAGADLAATNRQGLTPLDVAVWKNESEIAAWLRARGAPGTVTGCGPMGRIAGRVVDEDGRPPAWGQVSLELYYPNSTNPSSCHGMSFSESGAFSFGNLEKGHYRIRVNGVAHSAQDVSLDSPTSRVENIRLQVTRQEMLDAAFCTAIHFAFNTKELARLLNEGADINATDGQGHSALWHAIRDDNEMAAAFLRERGAAEPETPPE
jgi:ankyrin repeat protein